MRIEQVTAHAFGPIIDQTLEFAPGMTVITGVNESGKSSWHAAILSSLVGRRRGKGAATKDEKQFTERYRPWHTPQWRVSAIVQLDDGRRIELSHDLDGKVDCRAMDLALGTDVSCDIMFEGSPDASRFLGLDRKSFAATAVVRQSQLLSILDDADGLQEHLQRAAATAGTDSTAAAALNALAKFKSDNVGLDRANSTKPLRAATKRLCESQDELRAARREHQAYLDLVTVAEQRRSDAQEAALRAADSDLAVQAAENLVGCVGELTKAQEAAKRAREQAAGAAVAATAIAESLARARQLRQQVGDQPPDTVAEAEGLANQVADALAAWRSSPQPRPLMGPISAELHRELQALPAIPAGDCEPDPGVRTATDEYTRAVAILGAHRAQEPTNVPDQQSSADLAAAIEFGPARLRDLAAQLSATVVPANTASVGESFSQRLELARQTLRESEADCTTAAAAYAQARADSDSRGTAPELARNLTANRRRTVLLALAGVAAVAAIILVATGQTGLAVVFAFVVAAAFGVAGLVTTPSSAPTTVHVIGPAQEMQDAALHLELANVAATDASRAVTDLEGRLAAHESAVTAAVSTRAELEMLAQARGLTTDPTALQQLAAAAEQAVEQREHHGRWAATRDGYARDVSDAETRLRDLLVNRGGQPNLAVAVADLVAQYLRQCDRNADQDAQARRQPILAIALADRLNAEEAAEDAARRRGEAEKALRDAAVATGVDSAVDTPAADLVEGLRAWQGTRQAELTAMAERQRMWAELQALLDGRSLSDLESAAVAAGELSTRLALEAAKAEDAVTELAKIAESAAAEVRQPGVEVPPSVRLSDADEVCRAARDRSRRAHDLVATLSGAAENAEGVVAERSRTLASVTEAEEAEAQAEQELDRVTDLATTLTLTRTFLTAAQERVHRDIAPVLAKTLREWLPTITSGRYLDATVDPGTLQVRVSGAERHWRYASHLSTGTAEQVYLLLRVALAQRLSTTKETCPLLLDDVTVQADQERTGHVLDLLLRLSADRQIILFAQEPEVAEWARLHLADDPRHRIIELDRVSVV